MSGLTVTDLTTRTLTHHCVEDECHCDWRLSIYGCTEETAMYYIYIVNIALSGLVVAVVGGYNPLHYSFDGIGLIIHRIFIKGHRLWDYRRAGGCLRPKPVDSMLVLLTFFNILRLVSSVILVVDVAPTNLIARSFLFEIPWQFGYGSFALYLVGIAQTLAESHKAVSTGWLPSAQVVDLLGSWFFLWPFVINNVCSIISGALAYSNLYVAEVFARLLYGFWFLHDASLSGAVLFAGWRLVRILNSHLARFGKDGARYQAIKTGIFKIKMLVGIIIVCLMSFASFLLLYGILRDRIMTSTVGSVILSVIWTYLGPMTTVFVEAAIIINPKFEKNEALAANSSSGTGNGSTFPSSTGETSTSYTAPGVTMSFNDKEEMSDLKQQQLRYQQLYQKHALGPNVSNHSPVDRASDDSTADDFQRQKFNNHVADDTGSSKYELVY